jgi:hypothetical protein
MVTYQTRYIVAGAIGVPTLAGECLAETRRVHEDAADAILTRGVWVGFGGLKPRQVVIIDLTRLRLCRISPVGKRPFANRPKISSNSVSLTRKALCCGAISPSALMKSRLVALSVLTTWNGPHRFGAGRPKIWAKRRRCFAVSGPHDGVIEIDSHARG